MAQLTLVRAGAGGFISWVPTQHSFCRLTVPTGKENQSVVNNARKSIISSYLPGHSCSLLISHSDHLNFAKSSLIFFVLQSILRQVSTLDPFYRRVKWVRDWALLEERPWEEDWAQGLLNCISVVQQGKWRLADIRCSKFHPEKLLETSRSLGENATCFCPAGPSGMAPGGRKCVLSPISGAQGLWCHRNSATRFSGPLRVPVSSMGNYNPLFCSMEVYYIMISDTVFPT